MMLKWKLVALAVPLALLVACKDQPSAPQAAVLPNHAVAADFTNNPLGGGPHVMRAETDYFAAWWMSPDGKVGVIHTTFPLGWDAGECGPSRMGSFHYQNVVHWDTTFADPATRLFGNEVMDAWILLLDPTTPGPCWGAAIIASGWGKYRWNENNMFGVPAYTEAFSMKGEGTLTSPLGAKIHYNGLNRCTLNQDMTSWHCNTFINYTN